MNRSFLSVLALLCLPLVAAGQSTVPSQFSFQGRVVDASGTALGNGSAVNRVITFRIYNHATNTGTARLWSEQQNVTIASGDFNVLLGTGSAVPDETRPTEFGDVFNGAERFLGITVDDGNAGTTDVEISPRQRIVTGAFAFRARVAEKVDGLSITTAMIANSAVGNVQLADNAVTGVKIADGSITAAKFSAALPLSFSGNKVGVGTSEPQARLHVGIKPRDFDGFTPATATPAMFVTPTVNSLNGVAGTPEPALILARDGTPGQTHSSFARFDISRWPSGNSGPSTQLDFRLGHSAAPTAEQNATPTILSLRSNGTVGISATTPLGMLDIRGGAGDPNDGLVIYQPANNQVALQARIDAFGLESHPAAVLALNPNAGSVGIGTTSPASSLDIKNSAAWHGLVVRGNGGTNVVLAGNLGTYATVAAHTAQLGWADLTLNGDWAGNSGNVMVPGRVGIGTNAPAAALDVRGEVRVGNGSADTPGIHFYDGANTNWGIDSASGSLRFVKNLDEGSAVQAVTITNTGRVGIGTTAPRFPLDVTGFVNASINLHAYLDAAGAFDRPDNEFYNHDTTFAAEKRIRSAGFDVTSDARIKNNLAEVGTAGALDTVRQLRITDYRYIDAIAHGRRTQRGLIAQEVERIMPDAIRRSTDFVPDIFARALTAEFDASSRLQRVSLSQAHGLQPGNVVRLLTAGGLKELTVHAVLSPTEFSVPADSALSNVFVYGRRVDDFRTVDYDRVFSTGLAAIQEVAKQVDALKASEARNAVLEQRVRELEAKVAATDEWKAGFEKRFAVLAATKAAPATGNSQ